MASSSKTKALCNLCGNKNVGVFKCEGCSETFCLKHSNEHRMILMSHLDEIILDHDSLHEKIIELKQQKNDYQQLISKVNEWESSSIEKIRITADEVRKQLEGFIEIQNHKLSSELDNIAEQLRDARESNDFIETDLRLWNKKLQDLKISMANIQLEFNVSEDPSKILVRQLNVKSANNIATNDEKLVATHGNLQIVNNGCTAIQRGPDGISYVCSRNEYSFGRSKLRFKLDKASLNYTNVFGIVSKGETFMRWPRSFYGWSNVDNYYQGGEFYSSCSDIKHDLNGHTSFIIELVLDCDQRRIAYFNENSTNVRELTVNLDQCPFPWQFFFYLHEHGDCVQLLIS